MTDTRSRQSLWTTNLITLAVAVFFINFGQGLFRGASTNYMIDTLGLDGTKVLWLAGIREIPGLALMFVAALIMHIPLSRRAGMAVLIMGVGYGLYAAAGSYLGLIVVALIGSLGFHIWMPLQSSLAMSLVPREQSGRVMGTISSVRAFSSIIGMGAIALISLLAGDMPLGNYFIAGGLLVVLAGFLVFRIPTDVGASGGEQPRMLLRRRYWLFYVLTFFEGSRTQVFGTFGTLVLVQYYDFGVWQISLVLLVSGVTNLLLAPVFGRSLDVLGERFSLAASYVLLALCFAGYATFESPWMLGAMLVLINLLVMMRMGLSTYVRRIAPEEELTPTLSAGVSINHITSVTMSLLAGSLLALVGYQALCWGAAAIIMISVPFALAIKVPKAATPQLSVTAAK